MKKVGVHSFPCEAFDQAGKSLMVIMSQPLTVYERKDGTFFTMDGGRRQTIQKLPSGSFYLACRP
jgi:hypothetical protein